MYTHIYVYKHMMRKIFGKILGKILTFHSYTLYKKKLIKQSFTYVCRILQKRFVLNIIITNILLYCMVYYCYERKAWFFAIHIISSIIWHIIAIVASTSRPPKAIITQYAANIRVYDFMFSYIFI